MTQNEVTKLAKQLEDLKKIVEDNTSIVKENTRITLKNDKSFNDYVEISESWRVSVNTKLDPIATAFAKAGWTVELLKGSTKTLAGIATTIIFVYASVQIFKGNIEAGIANLVKIITGQ